MLTTTGADGRAAQTRWVDMPETGPPVPLDGSEIAVPSQAGYNAVSRGRCHQQQPACSQSVLSFRKVVTELITVPLYIPPHRTAE